MACSVLPPAGAEGVTCPPPAPTTPASWWRGARCWWWGGAGSTTPRPSPWRTSCGGAVQRCRCAPPAAPPRTWPTPREGRWAGLTWHPLARCSWRGWAQTPLRSTPTIHTTSRSPPGLHHSFKNIGSDRILIGARSSNHFMFQRFLLVLRL